MRLVILASKDHIVIGEVRVLNLFEILKGQGIE